MEYETPDLVVREVDGVTIARLRHANLTNAPDIARLAAELETILNRGARKLVIDFKYVEFIGSAALGMLISIQKKAHTVGARIVLSHSEKIAELLKVSHTASLFKLAPDPKAAFKLFT